MSIGRLLVLRGSGLRMEKKLGTLEVRWPDKQVIAGKLWEPWRTEMRSFDKVEVV